MAPEIAEETAQAVTEESATSTETTGEESAQSESTEATDTSKESAEAKEPIENDKGAKPSGAEERIRKLVAKQREAEREAAYWKGVAEGKQPKPSEDVKPKVQPSGKPTIDQYDNYDDYIDALTDWKVDQKLTTTQAKTEEEKAKATYQEKKQALEDALTEASEEDPDILEYYHDTTLPLSPVMAEVFLNADPALQVKYIKWAGENRKEAARISKMSPIAAIKELGKIEDRLLNPTKVEPKKVSQAPEPISTVKPKGAITNALDDDADISEFIKARNKQSRGRAA